MGLPIPVSNPASCLQGGAGLTKKAAMRRRGGTFAVLVLAPLLGGAASPSVTPADLEAEGWRKAAWTGIHPAEFSRTASRGIRIRAEGQGSFIARSLSGPAGCLAWRWRVDAGPPATDLSRRGGDDRAISISVGFAGF